MAYKIEEIQHIGSTFQINIKLCAGQSRFELSDPAVLGFPVGRLNVPLSSLKAKFCHAHKFSNLALSVRVVP